MRVAAGAFGFLIFNHAFDGPDLYGESTSLRRWTMGQYRAWRVDIRLFSINIRRLAMRFRTKVIVAALLMIPAVLTQTPASASWCAEYSDLGGIESCGFSSFEQCQATVSGGSSFCRPSQYNSPGYASAGRTKKRRY
jgi:hypothetical protein